MAISRDWEPENPVANAQEAEWLEQAAIADEEAAITSKEEEG